LCFFNQINHRLEKNYHFTLGKVDEKATQLHAIASLKVLLDATKPQDGINGSAVTEGGAAAGGAGGAGGHPGDLGQDSGRASQGTEVSHRKKRKESKGKILLFYSFIGCGNPVKTFQNLPFLS
jgi:hypothetical protein